MAYDPTFRTSQEYLNIKAGFTGPLRSKQECYASLSGTVDAVNEATSRQRKANTYAGTTGKTEQESINNKIGSDGTAFPLHEAVRRL